MITLADIKASMNRVLRSQFPDVRLYSKEVVEGFKKPCFFTQIVPVTSDYETKNYSSNRLIVVINYFSENGTELENLKMYNALERAFRLTFEVKDRSFVPKNVKADFADGALQFKFDLDYLDKIDRLDEEEYEFMKDLKLTQRGEV